MAFEGDNGAGTGGGAGSALDILGGAAAGDAGGAGGDAGAGTGGDAGAGGAGAGDAGAGGGGADPSWFNLLSAQAGENDEAANIDWVRSSGIKDIDGLVRVARDNQRALRDSGRVKVPGEGASADEVSAWRKAIGVPEDAKGYEIPVPKGENGEPLPLNTPLLDRLATSAHKAGMPKGAFEAVVSDFIQAQLEEAAGADLAQQQAAEAHVKSWGADKTIMLANVDKAAHALGLSRGDMVGMRNALGAERALDLLAKLGNGMAEDVMLTGGRARFGISHAEAQAEINQLKADKGFLDKMKVPGSPERVRWDRLQSILADHAQRAAAGV